MPALPFLDGHPEGLILEPLVGGIGCMTLDSLPNLSETQKLCLQNKDSNIPE